MVGSQETLRCVSSVSAGRFPPAANDYIASLQETLQASTETKHQQDTASGGEVVRCEGKGGGGGVGKLYRGFLGKLDERLCRNRGNEWVWLEEYAKSKEE